MKKRLSKILSLSVAALTLTASTAQIAPNCNAKSAVINKAKEIIKNNKGKIAAAGALTAGVIAIPAAILLGYKFCNSGELSANQWFEALGGTEEDIENYRNIKISGEIKQITLDIKRTTPSKMLGSATNNKEINIILTKILTKYDCEKDSAGYTQGMNDICLIALSKFYFENEMINDETEAKIYYVFKKMIKTIPYYRYKQNGQLDISNLLRQIKNSLKDNRSLRELLSESGFDNEDDAIGVLLKFYACPNRFFEAKQLLSMWEKLLILPQIKGTFNLENFEKQYVEWVGKGIVKLYEESGETAQDFFESKLGNLGL